MTVARARLAWLEASSHRRIELKPQTALWSLVNPIALATNIGVGLLSGGGTVSPLALLDAKIDVASADITARHLRFQREVEVTEKYNALALQQQWASQACMAVDEARAQRELAQEELRSSRATRLDVLWREQTVVDRKADCRRGNQATNIAAVALSTLLHGSVEEIRVADIRVETSSDTPLESTDVLYGLARIYREDLAQGQSAKQQILDLWDELETTRDSGSRVVLKDNGAFEAQKRLLAEKIGRVEAQSEELELQIRARIAEIRIRIESLQDQLDLAKERMALAVEQGDITWVRLRAGLAERSDMLRAEDLAQQASKDLARLRQEGSANVAALVAVVGLRDEPESLQALVYDTAVLTARNE
jgi:outer membrane protein TolC